MEIIKVQARTRDGSGKSYTRKARTSGWIPAIYYGHNRPARSIEINAREFAATGVIRNTMKLIDLGLSDESDSIAIVKEMQRHVIQRDNVLHIDFQHVDMKETIVMTCPIAIVGIPLGVKEDAGILGHPIRNLSIECLPSDIPDKIIVDVSALRVGDSIHVRDIVVPNVTIKNSPDEVLAVVTHAAEEIVTAAAPAAAVAAGAAGAKPGAAGAPAAGAAGAAKGDAGKDGKPAAGGKDAKPAGGKDAKK